jgi:hypothetical protein
VDSFTFAFLFICMGGMLRAVPLIAVSKVHPGHGF